MMNGIRGAATLAAMGCVVFAAAQGCGGSADSGLGGGGGVAYVPVAASDFASAYAHAACDDLAGCCTQNGYGYNQPACLAAIQGLVQAELVNPATVAGAAYDANAAGECVARARRTAQTCAQTDEEKRLMNAVCGRIYSGLKRPGEECRSTMDCAASPEGRVSCTSWSSASRDGGPSGGKMCQVRKTPAAVGDSCEGFTGSTAAPPAVVGDCAGSSSALRCDPETRTCQPRLALGQKCSGAGGCTTDAYCNYKTQLCEAKLAVGAACTSPDDCAAGASCDFMGTKTCVAKRPVGADCQSSSDCASNACKKSRCAANGVGTPELCGGAPAAK